MEAIDIYKGFKFRLYPNNTQSKKINKNFGYNRFVYNYYLTKIIKEGYKSTSYYIKDYTTRLKYEYQFLWEADPMLIKKIIFKLEDNYKKYIIQDILSIKVNIIKIVIQLILFTVIKL